MTHTVTSFKTRDAASYDHAAREFDRLARRYSEPFASKLLDLADIRPGQRVIDVGTGTGLLARAAARRTVGRVVGIDLSAGMLDFARELVCREEIGDRLSFRQGDAESLDLDTGAFDACVSLFALAHFPSPAAALAEMHRVLRPGGRLAIALGGGPSLLSLLGIRHALAELDDRLRERVGLARLAPRQLDRRLTEGDDPELTEWPWRSANDVTRLVRDAGFTITASAWHGVRWTIASPEEFWSVQATFSSVARKRLSRLAASDVERIRAEVLCDCDRVVARGGRLVFPVGARFVVARKVDHA